MWPRGIFIGRVPCGPRLPLLQTSKPPPGPFPSVLSTLPSTPGSRNQSLWRLSENHKACSQPPAWGHGKGFYLGGGDCWSLTKVEELNGAHNLALRAESLLSP